MATPSRKPGNKVCVVGAGAQGLVTAKNLLEQGLEVTVFERWDHIAGTWHASDLTDQTAALKGTTKNTSKHMSSFTDLPYPSDAATHPTAAQVNAYLEEYARKFDVIRHITLNTEVIKVERNEKENKWTVSTRSANEGANAPVTDRLFDRVVIVSGMLNVPNMPQFNGSELFKGDLVHSRQFRDAEKYRGKKVVVVGIGASSVDIQAFLVRAGAKVYISHRKSLVLLPRLIQGKALDHTLSHRTGTILRYLAECAPFLMSKMMSKGMKSMTFQHFPALKTHPSFMAPRVLDGIPHRIPCFDNDLGENLSTGVVQTCQGIDAFTGPKGIRLLDGTTLDDVDAVIVASGYHFDFSLIHGAGDPTDPKQAPDGFERVKKTKYYDPHSPFPRLFHGYISEQFPESLAAIGSMLIMKPPFLIADLETMALASLWSDQWPVPSAKEMASDIDAHYNFVVKALDRGPVPHPGLRWAAGRATYLWLNAVAGTGVNDRLGAWGAEAWKFWWQDRKFYNMLMSGVDTDFVYRLFDTGRGRKAWPGAREAIERTNKEVEALAAEWKREEEAKKPL